MESHREALIVLRSGKSAPVNGNGYWSDRDREYLKTNYADGADISELSLELGRTEASVFTQLFLMGMLSAQCTKRAQCKKAKVKCLCPNCECTSCPNYSNKEKCKRNV